MPWSTTSTDHRRYFSQFGRRHEEADVRERGRTAPTHFPAYGEGTYAAIREYEELYSLGHADVVVPLLEQWQHLERIGSAAEKQDFLEPLISRAQADPGRAHGELVMVLVALEPLRRGIAGRFLRSQQVHLAAPTTRKERADAKLSREVELRDVIATTRADVLRVVHSYRVGAVAPGAIFAWFKETLSHRLLEQLTVAFTTRQSGYPADEAAAVQAFLHGLGEFEAPPLRHQVAFQRWRQLIGAAELYGQVDEYASHPLVRQICRGAIDRLAPKQREVIERYYYERVSLDQIAHDWRRAPSTARNAKHQAEANLRGDEVLFSALAAVGIVRDAARLQAIHRRYPDGRPPTPTARRITITAA